ncbi:hypothetical protein SAMN05720473_10167 [Fibrobacter sp. UWB15]|uniref:hypothetical protein n=1 Tax=unclassified Fibrobacter TaxID=2634177 RepID=UPI000912002C|nr:MULTISPECIES: hypothetical protein [unclassified Fibrobacter]PWJ67197.1 hypothetical protein BGW99_10167 [Fibrobacter sp. UWB6]SHF60896.1 hypothetical protein SAMN05720760_10132 [Fibrobacter sp. UWB8]SMG07674.1 hypothetical protein SAMN05720473_10167 [Fibrobacter sp. UWB15]
MLKKLFLSAAIVALVFTACDSDSSTSPKNDEQPKDNVSEQSGTTNGDDANSSIVKTDPVSANTSTEVPCSVEKLSANSFVIKMKEDGAKTTITTTIAGGQAENDYVTEYDESVPEAMIQSLCESNKQEALTKNATVTCDGRTMKIHEIAGAEIGFDGALESAKEVCKTMNAYLSENSDVNLPEEPGSNETPVIDDPNPNAFSTSGKATCKITQKTGTAFEMVAVQPDSGSITTLYEYKMDSLVTLIQFDFLPAMPLDSINAFCAEAKVDAGEVEEDGAVVNVTCGDNTITERIAVPSSFNPLPFIAPEMTEYCEEIQRTGIIPDDEDDI